jgi:predicted dehydrogenase
MTSVALCGAGTIAGVHALAARELGHPVTAVASRSRARTEKRAGEFGARAVDYDELPAGADIVVVATPPAQHVAHALAALAGGASVLLEKPLCRTLAEADSLCAADGAERIVYAENLAFAPVIDEFLTRVRTLGPLTHLEARTLQSRPTWGDFLDPVWGGGVLFDLGVHPLALVVLVARATGNGGVESVRAELSGDSTDTRADVWLTFGSGLRAHVEASWDGPESGVWDLQASSRTAVLRADLRPDIALELNGDPVRLGAATAKIPVLEQFGYVEQLRSTVDRHVNGGRSHMDVEFGRTMLEVVASCYVSARRDADVPVPSGCARDLTPWELWRQ